MIIRFMSNNVWVCNNNMPAWEEKGMDCSAVCRSKGLAKVYDELLPDLLGLQESSAQMTDYLMEELGKRELPYAVLWGRDTPIFYRRDKFDLVDSRYFNYTEKMPGYEGSFNNDRTKSYNVAVFRIKKTEALVIFATTHLWWKPEGYKIEDGYQPHSDLARRYQMNQLLDCIDELRVQYHCPVVLTGDLNSVYTSPAIRSAIDREYLHGYDVAVDHRSEIKGYHYCAADYYDTVVEGDFSKAIDHILIKDLPEGTVECFERYVSEDYMALSDHFPVWIDVKFNEVVG